MTPAHLSAAVVAAVRAAVDDGELVLPGERPDGEMPDVVPAPGGVDADYLSAAPLRLAALTGRTPDDVSQILAGRLEQVPGVAGAGVTERGHCAVRLGPEAYGDLIKAIVAAGPRYARSRALDGTETTVARAGNLGRARDLDQARAWLTAEAGGVLTETAGGHVTWTGPEIVDGPGHAVSELLQAAGTGGTRYALLRTSPGARLDRDLYARADTTNPAYLVRYAHAHAAGVLRQAGDLGLAPAPADTPSAPGTAAERALLRTAADLPRRVATAAARPVTFPRYLEDLANAYLDWQGTALPRGDEKPTRTHTARVWLTAAVRTALATGLDLIGVPAPARM